MEHCSSIWLGTWLSWRVRTGCPKKWHLGEIEGRVGINVVKREEEKRRETFHTEEGPPEPSPAGGEGVPLLQNQSQCGEQRSGGGGRGSRSCCCDLAPGSTCYGCLPIPACSVFFKNKVLLEHMHAFTIFSVGSFLLQWQSRVIATEIACLQSLQYLLQMLCKQNVAGSWSVSLSSRASLSNTQPMGCMTRRLALSVAQPKFVNVLKTLWQLCTDFFFFFFFF